VARAALFLSCGDSSFTTGSVVFVDGGFTAAGMIARDVTARSDG